MNKIPFRIGIGLCALALLAACAPKETPEFVREEYAGLLDGVGEDEWGRRLELLREFDKTYGNYTIRDEARAEIAKIEDGLSGRVDFARNLARDGEIERADAVLRDLVDHFGGRSAGQEAAEYLRVEYPLYAAQMLLTRRRVEDAKARLEPLRGESMDPAQTERFNGLLDNIALVVKAENSAGVARFRSACQVVRTLLLRHRAETGAFPIAMDAQRLRALLADASPDHAEEFSEVTAYWARADDFELELTGAAGRKARITSKAVEPLDDAP